MGRLAKLAEAHYQKFLPKTYANLSDPAAFFQNLERDAETQIEQIAESLAGPDKPEETFEEKAGRLWTARTMAEERVIREVVLPTPEPDAQPPPWTGTEQQDAQLSRALQDFHDAARELLRQQHPAPPQTPRARSA